MTVGASPSRSSRSASRSPRAAPCSCGRPRTMTPSRRSTISGSEGQVAAPEPERGAHGLGGDRGASRRRRGVRGHGGERRPTRSTRVSSDRRRAGLLFDVDTGEVLWARRPTVERPIASLTKMMTALLIAEDHRAAERVAISAKAPGVEGSRIGVLKPGSEVPLRGLFLGLMMVSGNDAAVALAEHDAGSVGALRQADEPARRRARARPARASQGLRGCRTRATAHARTTSPRWLAPTSPTTGSPR